MVWPVREGTSAVRWRGYSACIAVTPFPLNANTQSGNFTAYIYEVQRDHAQPRGGRQRSARGRQTCRRRVCGIASASSAAAACRGGHPPPFRVARGTALTEVLDAMQVPSRPDTYPITVQYILNRGAIYQLSPIFNNCLRRCDAMHQEACGARKDGYCACSSAASRAIRAWAADRLSRSSRSATLHSSRPARRSGCQASGEAENAENAKRIEIWGNLRQP